MSDVVILQVVSSGFWLILATVLVGVFYRQFRTVLDKIGSFKIAGAHFELRHRQATLESYALLSDIFIRLLSTRDAAEKLVNLIPAADARQLAKFARNYMNDVAWENQDAELLKGVAAILAYHGLYREGLEICTTILKELPDDVDAENLRGVALLNAKLPKHFESAETIFSQLIDDLPSWGVLRFNRSLARSVLGQHDKEKYNAALEDLGKAIELGYPQLNFRDSNLVPLKLARPTEFQALENKARRLTTPVPGAD